LPYNARYYDPELGRFVQADTVVPSASNAQTLNRYSYCANNPLKYVDPTGHFIEALLIGIMIGSVIGAATSAATGGNLWMGILTGAIGGAFGAAGATVGGMIGSTTGGLIGAAGGGAAGGAVGAAATGGDIGKGALIGAISGIISFGVGQFNSPAVLGSAYDTGWADLIGVASYAAGGAAGGAAGAAITGGDPGLGAAYGAAGAAAGYAVTSFAKGSVLGWIHGHGYGRVKGQLDNGSSFDFRFRSGDDFVDWLDKLGDDGLKIKQFEFIGHGTSKSLSFGRHSLTYLQGGHLFTTGDVYEGNATGVQSVNSSILGAFAADSSITLTACDSYAWTMPYSPAYGFKYLLPVSGGVKMG